MADGQATGNVSSLAGQPGTLAQGMSFTYPYGEGPDSWVDEFDAAGGAVCLRDQSSTGRVVSYKLTGGYRTVCSAVIFGALRGPDRNRLMRAYLNHLLHGTGLAEPDRGVRSAGQVRVSPNPASGLVEFQTTGRASSVVVLDASGRSVTECCITDGKALWDASSVPAGTYFVVDKGSGQTVPFVLLH